MRVARRGGRLRFKAVMGFLILAALVLGGTNGVDATSGSRENGTGLPHGTPDRGPSPNAPSEASTASAIASSGVDMTDVRTLEASFNAVADEVLPVVVEINVVEVVRQGVPRFFSPWDHFFGRPEMDEREFRRPGLGSGVIVRRDGRTVYVLSNNHVVGDADEISIRLHDGREFEGRIVGRDERTDLALLSFTTRDDVPIARLGDSDKLDVGDWVLAVGNPFGFESTVTVGIVSALRRDPQPGAGIAEFTDYIQTDAAINPGNSGGALVDLDGEVIGINTWIASRSGGSVGLGFAIPINNAKTAIDDFIRTGRISYGWLGVTIGDLGSGTTPGLAEDLGVEGRDGVLITNVIVGSPADEHGLLPGDVVTRVDGNAIEDARALTRVIGLQPAGARTEIRFVRDGAPRAADVVLAERGEDDQRVVRLWPGFMVMPLNDEVREHLDLPSWRSGVVIADVARGTAAAVAGLRQGDVVTAVSGRSVDSARSFYAALNQAGGEVTFELLRAGRALRVGLVKEE